LKPFRWMMPTRLHEVVGILNECGPAARVLAGGTDLIVELRSGKIAPRFIVEMKRLSDLPPFIDQLDGCLTVSATATMSDVERHETVRDRLPALAEAASVVGSTQIRNRATLAGNVCNASPAADTIPVLAVYGAMIKLLGPNGERLLRVVDFVHGNRQTALATGEVVTAVKIPLPNQPFGAAFARITRRRGVDLATVSVCCGIDKAGMTTFAFGAVSTRPVLLRKTNGVLADSPASSDTKALDDLILQASPVTDVRGSAEYRLAMLRVLAERAQQRALERLADGNKNR
jgi:CO/xanthine dehydrogenase FAD-binding subunit